MSTAIYIAHWPGQDTPACEKHLRKLISLASVMGFNLNYTLTQAVDHFECSNCKSESEKDR